MSRSLCWKYWDHVSNCWHTVPWHYVEQLQLQDHDDIQGQPRQSSKSSYQEFVPCDEFPNLTVVDLMENSLLQRPHRLDLRSQYESAEEYREGREPMPSPVTRKSLLEINEELLAEKYDHRQVAQAVEPQKCKSHSVLDVQITKRYNSRVGSAKSQTDEFKDLRKEQSEPIIKADFSESLNQPQLIWLPQKRRKEKRNMTELVNSKKKLTNISLLDNFKPPEGTVIKMTNPITRHSRWIDPELKRLGYKVEPIQGTKVRPPTQLENFQCTPIKAYPPFDDNDSLASRPMTPVEIQRLRLLPSPIVRKCMDDALRLGVLDPDDTSMIMSRIRQDEYNGTPSRGNTPEMSVKGRNRQENEMQNPQRLISPLKYQRQPRNSGDPIYKIDNKEVIKPKWNRQPIAYKPTQKAEPVVPLHLEIPFFRESRDRRLQNRMQNWEHSLRETARVPIAHQRNRQHQQNNQLPYGQYERSLGTQRDDFPRNHMHGELCDELSQNGPLSARPEAPPSSPCRAMFNS